MVGGLLLVAAEFLTLYSVKVMIASCPDLAADPVAADKCSDTGGERHGYAFVLIGVVVVVMGVGAALRASRPAALALIGLALVVLAITLALDLPDVFSEGPIGERYEQAEAGPGIGFWLQVVGAGLALLAGVVRLNRPGGHGPGRRRRRSAREGPLRERSWFSAGRRARRRER